MVEAPAFWADLDFKDFEGGKSQAQERVKHFPFQPSGVVATGAGVHLYWRLKEPIQVSARENRALLERINRKLAFALGGDLNACDAARILRVPGTRNLKPGRGMFQCATRRLNDAQYNPSDFDELEDAPSRATKQSVESNNPIAVREGNRNSTLTRLAGTMRRHGMGPK